jgi:hypothetical protein
MKGFMTKMLTGAILVGGTMSAGCHGLAGGCKLSDPCWPGRYSAESRQRTVSQFEPQVLNGHVLDQTIWNSHFDAGSARLNAAGMDKLDQLARRRPSPDGRIFLQTARDIAFDAEKPAAYGEARVKLDSDRVAAIQKYLSATLTGRAATFDVQVHDPAPPGIDGAAPRVIVPTPQSRAGQGIAAAGGTGGGASSSTATPKQ